MSKTGVKVTMDTEDINVFAILGKVRTALTEAGLGNLCQQFTREATAHDTDHLVRTVREWVDVV